MNIDIRNLEPSLEKVIAEVKKENFWCNTNIKATKFCIENHYVQKERISKLESEASKNRREYIELYEKFEELKKALKVISKFT